jgi:peptidoglycan/LPS O-acetylase OafA/YrhL
LKPEIIPAEIRAHRYIEIDSLRGIGAWVVVFGHFEGLWRSARWCVWVDRSPFRVLFSAHEAVVLFFVLSGFVLSIQLSEDRPLSYGTFLLKRFFRIYLPYVAAILAAALGSFFLYSTVPTGDHWIDQTWSVRPTFSLVLGHLLTTTRTEAQLNTAIWTLIVEIRVSLIFPLIFWAARRLHPAIFLGLLAVLGGGLPLVRHGNSLMGLTISPVYVAQFLGGILLWLHLPKVSQLLTTVRSTGRGMVLLLSLLCLEGPHAFNAWYGRSISATAFNIEDFVLGAGAVGLLTCAIHSNALRHFLHHPILVRLGALSYSTYLMHPTVLFILIRVFYGKFPFYYLLPVYLVGVYIVSELFHRYVDQPSVLLGRRVGKRSKRPSEALM